eukprot:10485227-Lingulodinium_polyedra.AAC.1
MGLPGVVSTRLATQLVRRWMRACLRTRRSRSVAFLLPGLCGMTCSRVFGRSFWPKVTPAG